MIANALHLVLAAVEPTRAPRPLEGLLQRFGHRMAEVRKPGFVARYSVAGRPGPTHPVSPNYETLAIWFRADIGPAASVSFPIYVDLKPDQTYVYHRGTTNHVRDADGRILHEIHTPLLGERYDALTAAGVAKDPVSAAKLILTLCRKLLLRVPVPQEYVNAAVEPHRVEPKVTTRSFADHVNDTAPTVKFEFGSANLICYEHDAHEGTAEVEVNVCPPHGGDQDWNIGCGFINLKFDTENRKINVQALTSGDPKAGTTKTYPWPDILTPKQLLGVILRDLKAVHFLEKVVKANNGLAQAAVEPTHAEPVSPEVMFKHYLEAHNVITLEFEAGKVELRASELTSRNNTIDLEVNVQHANGDDDWDWYVGAASVQLLFDNVKHVIRMEAESENNTVPSVKKVYPWLPRMNADHLMKAILRDLTAAHFLEKVLKSRVS